MFFERNAVFTIVAVAICRKRLVNVLFPIPPLATAAGSTNPDRVLCLLLSALTIGFLLVLSVVFPTELLFEMLLTSVERFFRFPLGMAQCLVAQCLVEQ